MYSNCEHTLSLFFTSDLTRKGTVRFPHPACGRSSPPGHAVACGRHRDERTRDIPQSLLEMLVSSAKPTTGMQVVRPTAPVPRLAHSRCPQSRPFHTSMPACLRQPVLTPTPIAMRQLHFDPPFMFDPRLALSLDDLSFCSCGH